MQNVMAPIEYSTCKHEARLTETLNIMLRLKEKLPNCPSWSQQILTA